MKKIYQFLIACSVCCCTTAALTSCQDKDIEREAMKLMAPDAAQITGQLNGDDYTWTWPAQQAQMQVTIYRNGTLSSSETVSGNSFTHRVLYLLERIHHKVSEGVGHFIVQV
jgi:hypothetical protein